MAPITLTCTLSGTLSDGSASAMVIACVPQSTIRRSIGLYGDDLVVTVKAADWAALDWDVTKPISIVFGDAAGPITLGGYYFNRVSAGMFGILPEDVTQTIALGTIIVFLETQPRKLREARGGLLTIGTVNRLGEDGLVDTAHADYMTWQELVDAALDATGLAHDACPSSINTAIDGTTTLDAPGPLDWGNARAISELEALLAQVGYAAVFANDGSKISVVRLFRSGEILSLPTLITDAADTYYTDVSASLRGSTIVVTSGTTRATIVTHRSLDDTDEPALEWVAFDEVTGSWMNEAEWTAEYGATNHPANITRFQAGPDDGGGPESTRAWARLFSALRLVDDTSDPDPANHKLDRTRRSRFVVPTGDLGDLRRITGYAVGFACRDEGASMLVNWPLSDVDDAIRFDGVQMISGEGVFVLPQDMKWVRMNPGPQGTYSEARVLAAGELEIHFAHEADTGVFTQDYFVAAFLVGVTAGVVSLTALTGTDLDDAVADPMSVKIDAPFLRLISTQSPGDTTTTPLNASALNTVATQLALAKAGAALVTTAVIPLRGFINVEPGAASGAVSSVEWRLTEGRTIVQVNSHEVPQASYDRAERQARRSITAGLRRYSVPGSSAGLTDTRAGSTPGELAGVGGAGRGTAPEAASGTRGRDRALRGGEAIKSQGVRPGETAPAKGAGLQFIWAKITDSALIDEEVENNRFTYEWAEVYVDDDFDWNLGTRTSDDYGVAIAAVEAFNTGSGVEGNGVNVDNLVGTYDLQPLRGNPVVLLVGPYTKSDGSNFWVIAGATNAIDGACPVVL
ncbi:MAG: hypothetical protein KJZ65_06745 [Phycisphaerales bacterium]|nr:hypothetical protein [Phycisphaerales bacterium]